jgi:hypothetical protein
MSHETYEESRDDGGPTQLYLFRYGTEAGEYYAYTSHTQELPVDHGGSVGEITYTPVPVKRDAITSNGTLDKSALGLNLDVGTDLAELFRIYPPSSVVTLTIYEGHLDDPDEEFLVVWAGRIVSAGREGSELALSGEPISTQMRRPGLRRNYQYGCPHVLYGDQCGADKESATNAATVASVDGTTVTLDAGWEGYFEPEKFVRGMLEWTPAGESIQRRTIIRIASNTLTLSGLPTGLSASDTVDVVLGCNHKAFSPDGDCQALHDNLPNYGGDPWIPIKNVVNTNPYY